MMHDDEKILSLFVWLLNKHCKDMTKETKGFCMADDVTHN